MSWVDREGYQGPAPKVHRGPAARPPGAAHVPARAPAREALCWVGDFTPEGYDIEAPWVLIPASEANLPADMVPPPSTAVEDEVI